MSPDDVANFNLIVLDELMTSPLETTKTLHPYLTRSGRDRLFRRSLRGEIGSLRQLRENLAKDLDAVRAQWMLERFLRLTVKCVKERHRQKFKMLKGLGLVALRRFVDARNKFRRTDVNVGEAVDASTSVFSSSSSILTRDDALPEESPTSVSMFNRLLSPRSTSTESTESSGFICVDLTDDDDEAYFPTSGSDPNCKRLLPSNASCSEPKQSVVKFDPASSMPQNAFPDPALVAQMRCRNCRLGFRPGKVYHCVHLHSICHECKEAGRFCDVCGERKLKRMVRKDRVDEDCSYALIKSRPYIMKCPACGIEMYSFFFPEHYVCDFQRVEVKGDGKS